LSDEAGQAGLSLLNDSRYGFDVKDNTMRISMSGELLIQTLRLTAAHISWPMPFILIRETGNRG